jgi:hypothetical protein
MDPFLPARSFPRSRASELSPRPLPRRAPFTSLALSGGAPKDLVRWITHPRPADVFDLCVTPSWDALCAAVERIVVRRRGGAPSGPSKMARRRHGTTRCRRRPASVEI